MESMCISSGLLVNLIPNSPRSGNLTPGRITGRVKSSEFHMDGKCVNEACSTKNVCILVSFVIFGWTADERIT
jgi:hypothetical protein